MHCTNSGLPKRKWKPVDVNSRNKWRNTSSGICISTKFQKLKSRIYTGSFYFIPTLGYLGVFIIHRCIRILVEGRLHQIYGAYSRLRLITYVHATVVCTRGQQLSTFQKYNLWNPQQQRAMYTFRIPRWKRLNARRSSIFKNLKSIHRFGGKCTETKHATENGCNGTIACIRLNCTSASHGMIVSPEHLVKQNQLGP